MQLCDRFTYDIAVSRVLNFYNLNIATPFFLRDHSSRRTLVALNAIGQSFSAISEHNFSHRVPLSVQVGLKLYIYHLGFHSIDIRERNGQLTTKAYPNFTERRFASLANFQGKSIFLSGGFNPASTCKEVYEYRISSNTWSCAPYINQERNSHSSCAAGNFIYICGGCIQAIIQNRGFNQSVERLKIT